MTGEKDVAGLAASVLVDRGGFELQLELEVRPGTVTAVVGPNGAGKTTALRTLAGLLRPTVGRVELDGRVLDDAASGVHVDAAHRGIGVVFQDYLLFPHLSAADNIAFGLLARGVGRRTALARAGHWLERFALAGHASSRPSELSGGQAQRVALARALILEPPLLLLDEPLSALDAGTRLEVRANLAVQLRAFGGATVIVTHDPVDAIVLADELVVLAGGRVAQRGTPLEVSRSPVNGYVANLLGLNLLRCASGGTAVFSPSNVRLSVERPAATSDSVLRCRILGLEEIGGRVRVLLASEADDQRLTADLAVLDFATFGVAVGAALWARIPAAG